ncbi:MAG: MBOAT family protein [Bacteroidales bacterium]|nr:MBOAT family protein [Candidatus Colimorpha onthohippi]
MSNFLNYLCNLFAFDHSQPLLFTQFNFWAFFLIVFALFTLIVAAGPRWGLRGQSLRLVRNGYLTLVSLLFYYKTSGLFVILLILATVIGWWLGIQFDRLGKFGDNTSHRQQRKRKLLMIAGVTVNLAVLCYFKYAYFFTDIYNTITHSSVEVVNLLAQWSNHFTVSARFDASVILLPVGISFFTFQNISYIVDVYKGRVQHASNILDFAFYTTFFPQLVAGPIIRADQFIPQVYKPYHLGRRQFGVAVFWILNGLAKKIILSDYLAVSFVDRVFDNPLLYTPFENFSALMVYSLQVYADFSGYTDIAIGVAMLMGFYLPTNFNSPYKATNAAGFWKRWHISLSNWLKDYLYIPIGGNRRGTWASYLILGGMMTIVALMAQNQWVTIVICSLASLLVADYILFPAHRKEFNTNINNMDTMLLGGLWHGASFNFITWGGLNGLGILVYKYWKKTAPWCRMLLVTLLVGLLWIIHNMWQTPFTSMLLFIAWVVFGGIMLINCATLLCRNAANGATSRLVNGVTYVWNILLTFVFISFTRLFFRSGSNLNPAEANQVAWQTATDMVHQIGSHWNWQVVPAILSNYASVFILFAIGMAIHWLPTRFKRRYRIWFAKMPIWLLAAVVVVSVVVLYQFVTADLQPFIYFQF